MGDILSKNVKSTGIPDAVWQHMDEAHKNAMDGIDERIKSLEAMKTKLAQYPSMRDSLKTATDGKELTLADIKKHLGSVMRAAHAGMRSMGAKYCKPCGMNYKGDACPACVAKKGGKKYCKACDMTYDKNGKCAACVAKKR